MALGCFSAYHQGKFKVIGDSVSFTELVALWMIKTGQPRSVIPEFTLAVRNGLADLYVLKSVSSTMVCCLNRVAEPRTV